MNTFLKILIKLIPIKKYRKMARDFINNNGIQAFFPSKKIKIYYYKDKLNFGDTLNESLMSYFNISYTYTYFKYAQLICIGSILQKYLDNGNNTTKKPIHVFGSGFITQQSCENEKFSCPVIFHALRGKLTLKRCEKITNQDLSSVVLGDPGLLIKKIFPSINTSKKYDVGIICHYVDKNEPTLNNIQLKNLSVKYIDVAQSPKNFVEDVYKCKFILSSAMHGLICADSLGIPNKHIVLSDKVVGGEYKFKDYYSVFKNFVYRPIYLKNTIINDNDIKRYCSEYTITEEQVEEICKNLIKVFPLERLKK